MNIKFFLPLSALIILCACANQHESTQKSNVTIVKGENIEHRDSLRHKARTDKHHHRRERRLLRQSRRTSEINIKTDTSSIK